MTPPRYNIRGIFQSQDQFFGLYHIYKADRHTDYKNLFECVRFDADFAETQTILLLQMTQTANGQDSGNGLG